MRQDPSNSEVIQRHFDPADCNPHVVLAEAVAEFKDTEPDNLSPLYSRVDDLLVALFSDPPEPEVDVQITFTYEGYRITIYQDGNVEFVKV